MNQSRILHENEGIPLLPRVHATCLAWTLRSQTKGVRIQGNMKHFDFINQFQNQFQRRLLTGVRLVLDVDNLMALSPDRMNSGPSNKGNVQFVLLRLNAG